MPSGGVPHPVRFLPDVWRSTDKGATWTNVQTNPGWSARESPVAAALPDRSVVIAPGCDESGNYRNDTWRLQTAGSNLKNPLHTYGSPGTYSVALQANNSAATDLEEKTSYFTAESAGDKIGIARPSAKTWYLDASGNGVYGAGDITCNGAWNAGDSSYAFGMAGDIPVTGIWK